MSLKMLIVISGNCILQFGADKIVLNGFLYLLVLFMFMLIVVMINVSIIPRLYAAIRKVGPPIKTPLG